MMPTSTPSELRQRHLSERREFFLEPNRIRLYVKDFDGETETYIPYEKLTTTTRTITQQDGRVYIAAISFGIFALIGFALYFVGTSTLMRWAPLWAIASVIFFGFHFYKKRSYFLLDLSDGKSIFFLANRPSREVLGRFVKSVYESRKRYLRERYYTLDPTNDSGDELAKFQWLLKEEIITESEFQVMKTSLITHKKYDSVEMQGKGLIN
jgi:hypothetical protein